MNTGIRLIACFLSFNIVQVHTASCHEPICLWRIMQCYLRMHVMHEIHENFLRNCSQVNATNTFSWLVLQVNICSGNGLVPSDKKPLPEPMLIRIHVTIRCPCMGHNESKCNIRKHKDVKWFPERKNRLQIRELQSYHVIKFGIYITW